MPPQTLQLYVYYKIPANQSDIYLLALKQLHQTIAQHYPNIAIQQQKRPYPNASNQETWMETYAGVPHMQMDKLIAELSALAAINGLLCERKYEVFINL